LQATEINTLRNATQVLSGRNWQLRETERQWLSISSFLETAAMQFGLYKLLRGFIAA